MNRLIAFTVAASMIAGVAHAAPKRMERSVEKQRAAVAAWTECIADENEEEVDELLSLDFRSEEYDTKIQRLSKKRVSSNCFDAMPRDYRRITLGGLPFAGGLAEQRIKTSEVPLLKRLSIAAIGKPAATYGYTDAVANCIIKGAPHTVAKLFETEVNSDAEVAAFAEIDAVKAICTSQGAPVEASPLAMRSMLATASFRLLQAQDQMNEEAGEDA